MQCYLTKVDRQKTQSSLCRRPLSGQTQRNQLSAHPDPILKKFPASKFCIQFEMNMELSTKLYMQVQYTTDAMNTENNLFYVAINTKEISSWNRIFVFKQRSRKCNRFISNFCTNRSQTSQEIPPIIPKYNIINAR